MVGITKTLTLPVLAREIGKRTFSKWKSIWFFYSFGESIVIGFRMLPTMQAPILACKIFFLCKVNFLIITVIFSLLPLNASPIQVSTILRFPVNRNVCQLFHELYFLPCHFCLLVPVLNSEPNDVANYFNLIKQMCLH